MELKNTEKQEHSVVALTIEITKAEFEAAKDKAFKKTGKNITVPGFRKGKAPRKMIEKLYGEGVFLKRLSISFIRTLWKWLLRSPASSRSAVQTLIWATRQKRAA